MLIEYGNSTLTEEHPELSAVQLGPSVVRMGLKPVPPGAAGEQMLLAWYLHHTPYINVDASVLDGAPVFMGTTVPLKSLFDCLLSGRTIDDFLHDHPSVPRKAVLAVLSSPLTRFYERISKATASAAMPSSRPR